MAFCAAKFAYRPAAEAGAGRDAGRLGKGRTLAPLGNASLARIPACPCKNP